MHPSHPHSREVRAVHAWSYHMLTMLCVVCARHCTLWQVHDSLLQEAIVSVKGHHHLCTDTSGSIHVSQGALPLRPTTKGSGTHRQRCCVCWHQPGMMALLYSEETSSSASSSSSCPSSSAEGKVTSNQYTQQVNQEGQLQTAHVQTAPWLVRTSWESHPG